MAAILRVKRRIDETPANALVIACKRSKLTEDNDEAASTDNLASANTIAEFAGTITDLEHNVVKHLVKTLGKNELEEKFKKPPINILNKLRQSTKQASADNRYKVVNCHRSLDTSDVEEFDDKVMTLIDVENVSAVEKDSTAEQDENYAYDLYYANTENDMFIDNMVSVHTLDQELICDIYRNCDEVVDSDHESDDSNSESNWRNDYPDSEYSDELLDDDVIRVDFTHLNVKEDSNSSSEDDFIYAADERDVEAYGIKYAKYKANIKEEMYGKIVGLSDNSSESDDACQSNSSDLDFIQNE